MKKIYIRNLGMTNYNIVSSAMHYFTDSRSKNTIDEIWFTEHFPIFTQGKIKKKKYILEKMKNIPIQLCDRGGEITYHGPGQQLVYILINLKLRNINIKKFLFYIEKSIIDTLKIFSIKSYTISEFPGVYINKKKFCSIGFRIKNHCSLYGISYNINSDLIPYSYIYPCGNKLIKMMNLIEIQPNITMKIFKKEFIKIFIKIFKYKEIYKSPYNVLNRINFDS
ncbi:lipoyl(octanoyl) transferase LipB [Buchnera aphidicola (Periphyllus koelreuteriae)]|uniref:lipoyl(octanoyl) transferase LipB n=1 Tax=Buchnera aphidicola TaxID=9 RepID=UPI0031B842FB